MGLYLLQRVTQPQHIRIPVPAARAARARGLPRAAAGAARQGHSAGTERRPGRRGGGGMRGVIVGGVIVDQVAWSEISLGANLLAAAMVAEVPRNLTPRNPPS
jgi:hypothetical protein